MIRRPPRSTLFPTRRSSDLVARLEVLRVGFDQAAEDFERRLVLLRPHVRQGFLQGGVSFGGRQLGREAERGEQEEEEKDEKRRAARQASRAGVESWSQRSPGRAPR